MLGAAVGRDGAYGASRVFIHCRFRKSILKLGSRGNQESDKKQDLSCAWIDEVVGRQEMAWELGRDDSLRIYYEASSHTIG